MLQEAVRHSGVTDVIIDFLTDHYRISTTLHGLSLQMSRAFAQDATSSNLRQLDATDLGANRQGMQLFWTLFMYDLHPKMESAKTIWSGLGP